MRALVGEVEGVIACPFWLDQAVVAAAAMVVLSLLWAPRLGHGCSSCSVVWCPTATSVCNALWGCHMLTPRVVADTTPRALL